VIYPFSSRSRPSFGPSFQRSLPVAVVLICGSLLWQRVTLMDIGTAMTQVTACGDLAFAGALAAHVIARGVGLISNTSGGCGGDAGPAHGHRRTGDMGGHLWLIGSLPLVCTTLGPVPRLAMGPVRSAYFASIPCCAAKFPHFTTVIGAWPNRRVRLTGTSNAPLWIARDHAAPTRGGFWSSGLVIAVAIHRPITNAPCTLAQMLKTFGRKPAKKRFAIEVNGQT